MTIWFMRIECWTHEATNTNTDCVILIGFAQQQWLHERVSLLRHKHMACAAETYVHCVILLCVSVGECDVS